LQATEKYPNDNMLDMALFRAAFQLNRLDEAKACLHKVLAAEPHYAEGYLGLGQIALQEGDFDEAEKQSLRALEYNPRLNIAYAFLTNIKTFNHDDDALIEQIQKYRQAIPKDSAIYMDLSFTLGKVMDDLSEHQRAFEYIKKANDIKYEHLNYDHEAEIAHLHAIVALTSEEHLQTTSELEDDTPIFIVGMPRCGSTMIEQILASHPNVESVGESNFFEVAVSELNDSKDPLTLEKMQQFSAQQWRELGTIYMKKVREMHPDARYVVDKTLSNIRFVGAIHQALPQAKVIHVKRDALDTCWSIYKNNLLGPVYSYGFHLGQLAYYYRAYDQLMKHWADILPEGVLYELNYEEMVQHQDIETLSLLNACH
ncbi:MAG: sulfotransferase, partial [Mariprofundaceae bacterium]|nr:sulfotransferase [Mariprofundaceae bacterium]